MCCLTGSIYLLPNALLKIVSLSYLYIFFSLSSLRHRCSQRAALASSLQAIDGGSHKSSINCSWRLCVRSSSSKVLVSTKPEVGQLLHWQRVKCLLRVSTTVVLHDWDGWQMNDCRDERAKRSADQYLLLNDFIYSFWRPRPPPVSSLWSLTAADAESL